MRCGVSHGERDLGFARTIASIVEKRGVEHVTCKQVTAEKMLRISPDFSPWGCGLKKRDIRLDISFCKRETGIELENAPKSPKNRGGKHTVYKVSTNLYTAHDETCFLLQILV